MLHFVTCVIPANNQAVGVPEMGSLKINEKLVNHFFLSVVFHIKSLKNNNIMETKENLMQSMTEKQNEVVTEKFIADFALIDASVVQKKSAWDIANENPANSFVAFF